ncbi:MAG: hypothetical protein OXP66_00385 [Candidatus Tectomicrobia bacterium]|nr:hypothetical protein [Candidatus Tectomicrobia bacterium]
MISPHTKGSLGVLSYMAGHYMAIGFIVGIVVGAVVASVVWIVVL